VEQTIAGEHLYFFYPNNTGFVREGNLHKGPTVPRCCLAASDHVSLGAKRDHLPAARAAKDSIRKPYL